MSLWIIFAIACVSMFAIATICFFTVLKLNSGKLRTFILNTMWITVFLSLVLLIATIIAFKLTVVIAVGKAVGVKI